MKGFRKLFAYAAAATFFTALPALGFAGEHGQHSAAHKAHWSYEGETGPEHWGEMQEDYHACMAGKTQSPIDITNAQPAQLPDIQFSYQPFPLTILNNGHTVQVNSDGKSSITVDGVKYTLLQYHFHTPSEEAINGKRADMVVHLVHKNDAGALAVIGVLLNRGGDNNLVKTTWGHLPKKEAEAKTIEGVTVNAADVLPKSGIYYSFSGSLTTPPCSEGVKWMVMKDASAISDSEYTDFTKIFPMNARPVQPQNGRVIQIKQ